MRILHIETGRHLYGGAKQVFFLLKALQTAGETKNAVACVPGSAIGEACEEIGIPVFELKIKGELDPRIPSQIRKAASEFGADILHVHSRKGVDVWGGRVARKLDIRSVISRRVDNPEPSWLAKWKYGSYDKVITISEGIKRVLVQEGIADEHITVVRSALDIENFAKPISREEFEQRFSIPKEALTIACAAQMIPRKGQQYLIEAIPEMLQAFPNVRVLLFGKGKTRPLLEEQVRDLELNDIVQFPGFVEDIQAIYPHIDVIVHPALMEGLGVTLIEASYAAVPLIATPVGGIPEIARNDINAIHVPPENADAIAQTIVKLLTSKSLRQKLGEAGRKLVEDEFSISPMARGNLEAYQRLCNLDNVSPQITKTNEIR